MCSCLDTFLYGIIQVKQIKRENYYYTECISQRAFNYFSPVVATHISCHGVSISF